MQKKQWIFLSICNFRVRKTFLSDEGLVDNNQEPEQHSHIDMINEHGLESQCLILLVQYH